MNSVDVHLPEPVSTSATSQYRGWTAEDQAALARAVEDLEHVGLAGRLTTIIGRQISLLDRFVPAHVAAVVNKAAETAMRAALHLALRSLRSKPVRNSRRFHKMAAVLSGAAGGAFGIASLPVELPFSTTIMLRSIADIAREHGEDLTDPETALACLQVFALGGRAPGEAFTESGYFAARALLAKSVSEASRYLVERAVADETAPVLLRLMAQIAARFGVIVSQKVIAQGIPVIGAAGGAAINFAFIGHFQSVARGHFTVRRLERIYGADPVRAEYQRLATHRSAAAWASAQ